MNTPFPHTPTLFFFTLCTTLALHGCCSPPPLADIILLNTSDKPVTLQVSSRSSDGKETFSDPVKVAPKSIGVTVGHSGPAQAILKDASGKVIQSRDVLLRMDETAFISTPDEPCAAVADYTSQYGPKSSGKVDIITISSHQNHGSFARHNIWLLLAPGDKTPEDIVEGTSIHRALPVPCNLVSDTDKLAVHMSFIP